MPRQPRLDAPDTLYHVMVRGIERTAVFRGDADRTDFLDRLARLGAAGGPHGVRMGYAFKAATASPHSMPSPSTPGPSFPITSSSSRGQGTAGTGTRHEKHKMHKESLGSNP